MQHMNGQLEVIEQFSKMQLVGTLLCWAQEAGNWSQMAAYRRFVRERTTMRRVQSTKQFKTTAVDFRRIWCDKGLRSATNDGISIWRPVPPDGYCSLGVPMSPPHTARWHARASKCNDMGIGA